MHTVIRFESALAAHGSDFLSQRQRHAVSTDALASGEGVRPPGHQDLLLSEGLQESCKGTGTDTHGKVFCWSGERTASSLAR